MDVSSKSIIIRGERCSGTTYIQKLIETNFNIHIPLTPGNNIGWKHGFIDISDRSLKHLNSYITIIIFRNPFDWLKSFYLQPHHLEGSFSGVWKPNHKPTFSEFIRNEIKYINADGTELMCDRHPFLLTRPKNLLELRKWKTEHFLNIKNVIRNTYYIRYEDLVQNPEKIITEINDKWFNIDFKFKNWTKYKNNELIDYIPKRYFDILHNDYTFLIENIDWELESKIGYYI
jgi:hypothetical protein